MKKFKNLLYKIQNKELKIYLLWRFGRLLQYVLKPISPLLNLIKTFIYKPKYLNLLLKILFTNNIQNVEVLTKEIKKYDYEVIEGYLAKKQREKIIQLTKHRSNILEIGFNLGHTAEDIIVNSNSKLTCIDNFRHTYSHLARLYINKKYKNRVSFINSESVVALEKLFIKKYKFDVIFIDGDHSYEGCLNDINLSLRILNEKGIIIIDNLEMNSVNDAINLYLKANQLEIIKVLEFKKSDNLSDIGIYKQIKLNS